MAKDGMEAETIEWQCSGCWRLCRLMTDNSHAPTECRMDDTEDETAEWRLDCGGESDV